MFNVGELYDIQATNPNGFVSWDEKQFFINDGSQEGWVFLLLLRHRFARHFQTGEFFNLPLRALAKEQFVPGFRGYKKYVALIDELCRFGFLRRSETRQGQRAVYSFADPSLRTSKVICLSAFRR